jgi:hypothetical protein
MEEWEIDRWIGVAGDILIALAIVIGWVLAYVFYRKSMLRSKLLAYAYTSPVPTRIGDDSVYNSPLTMRYGQHLVLFWNRGTSPITELDFVEPIVIETPILAASIYAKDAASAVDIGAQTRDIYVRLLRPNEAFIIEVLSPESSALSLSIKMVSAEVSEYFERTSFHPFFLAFMGLVAFVIIMSGFVLFQVYGRDKSVIVTIGSVIFFSVFVLGSIIVELFHRRVIPTIVWKFLRLKDKASEASDNARRFEEAIGWLQREKANTKAKKF